jgi:hypothetical protein
MHSDLPRRIGNSAGPVTKTGLFVIGMIGFICACRDGGPPASGAGANRDLPDAAVRVLPGEGFQATPETDTDGRQVIPVSPDSIIERVNDVRVDLNPGLRRDAGAAATAADAGDAGSDAGGQT